MNLPPRIHPSGMPYNADAAQVGVSSQIEAQRQLERLRQQTPQQVAGAQQVLQNQLAMESTPEIKAANLVDQVKGGMQAMALQLDPSALPGTRAMVDVANRSGGTPEGLAALLGMG